MFSFFKKIFNYKKHEPKYIHNLWENQKGWGWDVYFSNWEKRRITGHHPNRYQWGIGNEVRSKMKNGRIARFKIVEFQTASGVNDMFFCTVDDIDYLENEVKTDDF